MPKESEQDRSGISPDAFISDLPGFDCIFKHRYEDFVVNEIDLDGKVVLLNENDATGPSTSAEKTTGVPKIENPFSEEQLTALNDVLNGTMPSYDIDTEGFDKSQRREVHEAIRELFQAKLQSITSQNQSYIIVKLPKDGRQQRKRGRWLHDGDYCVFVMLKSNNETQHALTIVAHRLRMNQSRFGVAGTKDRRSMSTQRVSVYREEAGSIARASKQLAKFKISVGGPFTYEDQSLGLGDLIGNRFTVTLRDVKVPEELPQAANDIASMINIWKTHGFLNFYGDQRFGTGAISTADVGLALLHRQWKRAIELIMESGRNIVAQYTVWRSADAKEILEVLKQFKRKDCIEAKLLRSLSEVPTNYKRAFQALPRNTRNLYVHAYQSRIWNRLLCQRVSHDLLKPIEGDLVANSDDSAPPVRHLTASEVYDVSFKDVLLPLPGADVCLPKNIVTEWYNEMLHEDELSQQDFESLKSVFAIGGDYRAMVVIPSDCDFVLTSFDDPTESVVNADLICREDVQLRDALCREASFDRRVQAAVLRFSLPAGCYATMALRELTRQDLSKANQRTKQLTTGESDEFDEFEDAI